MKEHPLIDIATDLEIQANRLRIVSEHFADPDLVKIVDKLEKQASALRILAIETQLTSI
jgi:hypothetical protein